jgi:hypothetical protein
LIMKLGTLPRQNDGFLASMYTRFTIMSWILQNITPINQPLIEMR